MTINISVPRQADELEPRITVIGVGGAGGNAVNNMIRSNLEGVEFIVANTDSQALALSLTERRVQLGPNVTQALGAGACPEVGREAAEETIDELITEIGDSNMVFITAGMGGGTGTGAAPVIAQAALERGILTVGVVTKPFHFEGTHRMRLAEHGVDELSQFVDTLIIIPNQNLFRVANEKTTFADAFNMADTVLQQGVRGVTDLMVMPGLINLDFADIRTVMSEMGKAMMGTGEATGEKRAIEAVEAAISNPLLDDMSMKGAHRVLVNITGGMDMTLYEVDEATNRIREEVDSDANIIFGSALDERLEGLMRVSVVATGMAVEGSFPRALPGRLTVVSDRTKPAAKSGVAAAPAADSAVAAESADSVPTEADGALAAVAEATEALRALAVDPAPDESGTPQEDDVFVAPPPAGPDQYAGGTPESAPVVAAAEAAAQAKPRNRSLLGLMTGLGRRERQAAAAVEPALSSMPQDQDSGQSVALRPAAGDSPAPASDQEDRPTLQKVDNDLVDIPAFLRRTAN